MHKNIVSGKFIFTNCSQKNISLHSLRNFDSHTIFIEDTMRTPFLFFILVCLSCVALSCEAASTGSDFGIMRDDGLSVSVSNVTMLVGAGAKSIITGGTEPYSITENSNSSAVSAQISGREVQISAIAEGTTTIKVKDSSSPVKTATISVGVKTTIVATTAGLLSFSSNRGDFSVNGIGEYGVNPPTSGSGAIALQAFDAIMILAYKVNSSTDIDIAVIGLESNTSVYSGSFFYPSSGKAAYITYYPNVNPNDSSSMAKLYILASSATANIQEISSSNIQGTFSGNGYFVNNGINDLTKTIAVTSGDFNLQLINVGMLGKSWIFSTTQNITGMY